VKGIGLWRGRSSQGRVVRGDEDVSIGNEGRAWCTGLDTLLLVAQVYVRDQSKIGHEVWTRHLARHS
jgi:hypothetical protein